MPIEPTGSADQANTDPEQTQPVETEQLTEAPTGSPEAETEISDPVAPEEPETDQSRSEAVAALTVPVVPALPVAPSPEPAAIPVVPSQPDVIEPEPPETTEALSEPSEGKDTEGTELAVTSSPRPRVPDRQPVEDTAGVQDGTADEVDSLFDPSRRVESPITVFQRDGVDLFSGQNRSSQSGNRGFAGSGGTGNSDQTNYKGRVLVHLNRFANTRVSARGWVRVTMTINGDGSLGSIAVVDSSGSEEIERLAITTARRAAPFPKPPSGLARTLTFPYSSDQ